MARYVALLRGINLAGKKRLGMKDLRGVLEALGGREVQTILQSGNALFTAPAGSRESLRHKIAEAICERCGFAPEVILLTPREMRTLAADNPYPTGQGTALHVGFLAASPAKPDLERLEGLRGSGEEFQLKGKVFFLYAPGGIGRSKLAGAIEKALGVPATFRNWSTVCRLLQALNGA